MLNIVEMKMLNQVAKREGSVIVGSDPIFLFNCFSLSILDPVKVFSMAFTSFTLAVGLVFIVVNALTFTFLKFCVLHWS